MKNLVLCFIILAMPLISLCQMKDSTTVVVYYQCPPEAPLAGSVELILTNLVLEKSNSMNDEECVSFDYELTGRYIYWVKLVILSGEDGFINIPKTLAEQVKHLSKMSVNQFEVQGNPIKSKGKLAFQKNPIHNKLFICMIMSSGEEEYAEFDFVDNKIKLLDVTRNSRYFSYQTKTP